MGVGFILFFQEKTKLVCLLRNTYTGSDMGVGLTTQGVISIRGGKRKVAPKQDLFFMSSVRIGLTFKKSKYAHN